MKYRVGRKQKRVILDEKGHEVAICHKGKEEVAKQICDLLNEHGLVSKNESLHDVVEPKGKLKCVDTKHYKSLTKGKYYQKHKNPNGIELSEKRWLTIVDDKGKPQRFLKGCFEAF